MEYKHIEYFIETCGYKSMSQAAEALFISQQALSRCIANLEEELGCKLFLRTVKGSTLTEEGKYLYEQFNPLVQQFRSTISKVSDHLSHLPRTLTFACAPLIFRVLDAELLLSFQTQYPQIRLERRELSDKDVDAYVAADDRHLGMLAIPENRHGQRFEYVPIKTLPLYLYVHKDHLLAGLDAIEFSMLREENILALDERSHYRSLLWEKAREAGFEPRIGFESADVDQLCGLVNRGKGVLLGGDIPSVRLLYPNIALVPFADPTITYCIAFTFRDYDKLEAPARKFIEYITENA